MRKHVPCHLRGSLIAPTTGRKAYPSGVPGRAEFGPVLLTVLTQPCGELSVVPFKQLGKMGWEEPLQWACSPRSVGARCRGIHGQSELACRV